MPRARRLLVAAVLAAALAVPATQEAGALPCAPPSDRSITGTVRGVDDRFVNVTLGVALHDAGGHLIDRFGCQIADGYALSTSLNQTAPLEGADTGTDTFTFTDIPENAARFWIEHYPRQPSPYRTNRSAYGGALLRDQPLAAQGATAVALVAPIACGRPGGTTGGIEVHAFLDGQPAGLERVAAWSESPQPDEIRGWGVDSPAAPHPSTWTISSLEAGQRYTVRATIDGQTARTTYGVPVRPCEDTEIWVWVGEPPADAPPRWTAETFAVGGDFRPVAGDLDGDGRDDILWHGPGAAPDRLWTAADGQAFTASSLSVNGSYWPVSGDLDGNGVDDLLWYGPGSAPDRLWLSTPGGGHVSLAITAGATPGTRAFSGDLDGNGFDDVLFSAPTGASVIWWHGPEGRSRSAVDTAGAGRAAVTDVDGDGTDDIVWHRSSDGAMQVWYGRANRTFARVSEAAGPGAQPLAGDLDGDLRGDVLLYRPGPGSDSVWRGLDRRTPPRFAKESASAGVGGSFTPITGDFDGNHATDLFFYAPGPTTDRLRWGDPTGWYRQQGGAERSTAAPAGAPVGATSPL